MFALVALVFALVPVFALVVLVFGLVVVFAFVFVMESVLVFVHRLSSADREFSVLISSGEQVVFDFSSVANLFVFSKLLRRHLSIIVPKV